MRRLTRNALPVGARIVNWHKVAQALCMLCDEVRVETAQHLFWECPLATEVWGSLISPWHTHHNMIITWEEVLRGYEVRMTDKHKNTTEHL